MAQWMEHEWRLNMDLHVRYLDWIYAFGVIVNGNWNVDFRDNGDYLRARNSHREIRAREV